MNNQAIELCQFTMEEDETWASTRTNRMVYITINMKCFVYNCLTYSASELRSTFLYINDEGNLPQLLSIEVY
jgi:hypothetical protein